MSLIIIFLSIIIYILQLKERFATYTPEQNFEGADYFLEKNHTHFLLCDDGTHGRKKPEPFLQRKLEKYIRQKTSLGDKGIKLIDLYSSCTLKLL